MEQEYERQQRESTEALLAFLTLFGNYVTL